MGGENLDCLRGKRIESAIIVDDKDEKTFAHREILIIKFDDGSKLIVKSWDFEEYMSGLEVKYDRGDEE